MKTRHKMIRISKHALMRYLERFEDIDVEATRQFLISSRSLNHPGETMEISDYEVLRYLERFEGIDVKGARRSLLEKMDTPRTDDVMEFVGRSSCKFKKAEGTFCVTDGTLTTCYPHN